MKQRPIFEIAREISGAWVRPYFGAVPYLDAMHTMRNIAEDYGLDTGKSVIRYFLANAGTWRGDTARRIKAELKAQLGE